MIQLAIYDEQKDYQGMELSTAKLWWTFTRMKVGGIFLGEIIKWWLGIAMKDAKSEMLKFIQTHEKKILTQNW